MLGRRLFDRRRLLLSLDSFSVHRPVILLLQSLDGFGLVSEWSVSTESCGVQFVCDENRFLISLDWSSVHRSVISHRHPLFGWPIYSVWWESTEGRKEEGVSWESIVDLTRLIFNASASDPAPSPPISLRSRFRLVSVYRKLSRSMWRWWEQVLDLTWLIFSALASDLAPSPPISLSCRFREVSVFRKLRRSTWGLGVGYWTHLIDIQCNG